MAQKINFLPDARDELIAAQKRENELQRKIIKQQENTIKLLEEQLKNFEQLMKEILNSED